MGWEPVRYRPVNAARIAAKGARSQGEGDLREIWPETIQSHFYPSPTVSGLA